MRNKLETRLTDGTVIEPIIISSMNQKDKKLKCRSLIYNHFVRNHCGIVSIPSLQIIFIRIMKISSFDDNTC